MHIRPAELADAPALTAIYNAGSAAKPAANLVTWQEDCLLYTSPSPRDS